MQGFLIRRLITLVISLWVASLIIFTLARMAGDPRSELGVRGGARYQALGRLFGGLDRPLHVQYLSYVGNIFKGDLGRSIRERRPVTTVLAERIPNTLKLGATAFILAMAIGVPLGVLAAQTRGSILDYSVRFIAMAGQSATSFWLGIMLIFLFAVKLRWLPPSGHGGLLYFVLPTITLAAWPTAVILRLTRNSLLE